MADQYVNGRRALLQALDNLLAQERNIKQFSDAFQKRIDDEPLEFFKTYVMPLMPKEDLGLAAGDDDGKQQITIEFKPATPKKVST